MRDVEIHTLNTRDNVFSEVVAGAFSLTDPQLQGLIRGLAELATKVLAEKGVAYKELRAALVPQAKRFECAFVFDRLRMTESFYSLEPFRLVGTVLGYTSSHSILTGELGPQPTNRESRVRAALQESIVGVRDLGFRDSAQYYIVYVNNLTARMRDDLHSKLSHFDGYVGYLDVSFQSWLKGVLSTRLQVQHIRHRRVAITSHPEDIPNDRNYNAAGFPFDAIGLEHRSLQEPLFLTLLSYKIERPVLSGLEADSSIALKVISDQVTELSTAPVRVDARRLRHLLDEKAHSVQRLEVDEDDVHRLESLISAKLDATYIYSLRYRAQYSVSQFSMVLEHQTRAGPRRLTAGFKYLGPEAGVELLTLF